MAIHFDTKGTEVTGQIQDQRPGPATPTLHSPGLVLCGPLWSWTDSSCHVHQPGLLLVFKLGDHTGGVEEVILIGDQVVCERSAPG